MNEVILQLQLLGYFTFSDKRDSVGVLSNLFPCGIALYNLFLDVRHQRRIPVAESE